MSEPFLDDDDHSGLFREHLAAIVTSSDDIIVSKTLDGIITSWNPAAERVFGWTAAEAVGQHITLIVPQDRRAEEDDVLARLRRGERIDHFETVRVTKDGRLVDVSITVSPLRDRTGRVIGASKVGRDITQRRMDEAAQQRLAAIVDSSDDIMVTKTLDGIITSWNTAAERILGWTAAEAIGQHITLIIPEDRHAEEGDVLARIRRGERVDHFETVRITKDRRLLDVSITVSPLRDGSGRVVGASKVGRDITERRRNELAARRLAAVVESSDDVIVSKTLDGIVTSWNEAAERIFGWSAAEAVGRHITLIIPDDRRAEEDDVLARIRRGERVAHFETVRVAKNGRLVDVSITVSPIRDATGRVVGASKVGRDISERRRLEEQRAALLDREQEARRQAEALNRAKDEMLATVSHELRTPLNSIFGWARMLQTGELDEPTRVRAIHAILRSASAQTRLVEDLIDLSRIAAGRMRLDFDEVDLNATIEAALETVRPAAQAKGITLAAVLDDSIGWISGAPDRLQQVMWNLLMNAVKFTPSGGHVDLSSRRAGDAVVIVVKDSGRGISAEILPYIFEPFLQGDSSSTRSEGGLGLGLALVRRLVDLHGGEVVAESAGPGLGSTFTLTLPLPAAVPGLEASGPGPAPARRTRSVLEGTRVLVVDDDPEFLELSAMTLRRAGADVRAVASAARAHEVVQTWVPNVLLTDLAMPGEDGFALATTIRRILTEQETALSIIAVTAYGTPESRARAVFAGFDLYLTKPLDPFTLAGSVAEVIRRGR
jgi:PAS domain S-box-containing protein